MTLLAETRACQRPRIATTENNDAAALEKVPVRRDDTDLRDWHYPEGRVERRALSTLSARWVSPF
jgi:hypothetical protein